LALTSPTGGGRSVGIVRSRTKATELQQPLVGQGLYVIEAKRSHLVGVFWTSDQPIAETST